MVQTGKSLSFKPLYFAYKRAVQLSLSIMICTMVLACSAAPEMPSDSNDVTAPPPPPPYEAGTETVIEPGGDDPVKYPISALLADLRQYPIAYETPEIATTGEAFDVTLAIDASGDDSALEGLPAKARIVESQARLSKDVEATLSGAAFDIELTTSRRQTLSPLRESVWRWSVTPRSAGEHSLFLEIHALLGPEQTMLLESYSDVITVSVSKADDGSRAENLRTYISILGGIISILLGLIALKAHYNNRGKDKNTSE